MQLISPIYCYWSPGEISVQNIGTDIIAILDQYLTDISPNFLISVPLFLVLPSVFLLISAISVLSLNQFLLAIASCKKVNLLMVGEYTRLLVLNCYIYKFCMIFKLPKSQRDYQYLKYWSLISDILPH
ncbi:hypothetical protein Hanom_Chr12g01124711 [Helianthus anomalus]